MAAGARRRSARAAKARSSGGHPVPAGQGRGGEHHQYHERTLDETDPREAARGAGVGNAAAGHLAAPLNQPHHRPHFKRENRSEKGYLGPIANQTTWLGDGLVGEPDMAKWEEGRPA